MESKFDYKIKHHIVVCAYEKLWIILTALMLVSVILMIRGSTAPLLIDNVITRTLFCSDVNGDKTIYNIAISYFAAYIFYILQVYYPERKKTRDALITTSLDVYNLINQTRLFMFVWEEVTNRSSDGAILNVDVKKFYYKNLVYNSVCDADINSLYEIANRIKEDYDKIINNYYFGMCDEYIRKLFVEKSIHNEIRKLVLLALSAQTASDTYAMFFETYSPEDVEELKTKVSLIENIYGFSVTAQYEITEDEKEIADWENKKKVMEDFIKKNVNFFKNLPEGYEEILK